MSTKLSVGNLGSEITEQDLEALFAQVGVCKSAAVLRDKASGASRGFGFVKMGSSTEAQQAIQIFNGADLQGKPLTVNEARDQDKSESGGDWTGR